MKRFWTSAQAISSDKGFRIALDGRPVLTPARAPLLVPSRSLAQAIAAEWNAVAKSVDPQAMPLTGLANAAIDRVAPDRGALAAEIARYGESDLACYRAKEPAALVRYQSESWDSLLGWARRRFDADFTITQGILPIAQPKATIDRLAYAVAALDPFQLAGLSPLVTIGGSLVAGLAVIEGAIAEDEAWHAVTIDDRWQLEQWGRDAEAEATLEGRHRDFCAAARFSQLLD